MTTSSAPSRCCARARTPTPYWRSKPPFSFSLNLSLSIRRSLSSLSAIHLHVFSISRRSPLFSSFVSFLSNLHACSRRAYFALLTESDKTRSPTGDWFQIHPGGVFYFLFSFQNFLLSTSWSFLLRFLFGLWLLHSLFLSLALSFSPDLSSHRHRPPIHRSTANLSTTRPRPPLSRPPPVCAILRQPIVASPSDTDRCCAQPIDPTCPNCS